MIHHALSILSRSFTQSPEHTYNIYNICFFKQHQLRQLFYFIFYLQWYGIENLVVNSYYQASIIFQFFIEMYGEDLSFCVQWKRARRAFVPLISCVMKFSQMFILLATIIILVKVIVPPCEFILFLFMYSVRFVQVDKNYGEPGSYQVI